MTDAVDDVRMLENKNGAKGALLDDLTGLPNRSAGIRYIENMLAFGRAFWVFYIDIRHLSDLEVIRK